MTDDETTATQAIDEFKNKFICKVPSPPILYHYTNINSLNSILESNSIWMSHIHDMNDHREFHLGFDLFIEKLNDNKPQITNTGLLPAFVDKLIELINQEKVNTKTLTSFIY